MEVLDTECLLCKFVTCIHLYVSSCKQRWEQKAAPINMLSFTEVTEENCV
jgi:hypothetical protein